MFINKLNQLYKPRRILYYTDADDAVTADFRNGKICDKVSRYADSFGTYDYPGIYYIKSLGKAVIGIEFREDDENVAYPDDLRSTVLEGAFFYSIEIDNDVEIDIGSIHEIFNKIRDDDDAHRACSDLSVKEDPDVICMFLSGKKLRILCDMRVDEDRAVNIIKDDYECFEKKDLFTKAYIDHVTNHYTWNHLVPFLEMPMDYGIKDYAFVHFDI